MAANQLLYIIPYYFSFLRELCKQIPCVVKYVTQHPRLLFSVELLFIRSVFISKKSWVESSVPGGKCVMICVSMPIILVVPGVCRCDSRRWCSNMQGPEDSVEGLGKHRQTHGCGVACVKRFSTFAARNS